MFRSRLGVHRPRRLALMAVFAAALIVATTGVVLAVTTYAGPFTGCLTAKGTLYNVKLGTAPTAACATGSKRVAFSNAKGPKGDTGAPGPSGAPGPQGPAAGLGTAVLSANTGGSGGSGYDLECPTDSIATGIEGTLATFEIVGAPSTIVLHCTPISTEGFVFAMGATTNTAPSNSGSAGSAYSADCAVGSVMTGLSGKTTPIFGGAATAVNALSIQCTPLGKTVGADTVTVNGPSAAGGTPFTLACPGAKLVTGTGPSNAGQLLDAVRTSCR